MQALGRSGTSAIVIGVLLIMVIAGVVLLTFVFLTGMSSLLGGPSQANNTGLQVLITPHLYSSDAQVGVLNQKANFTIVLSNTVSTVQVGKVDLESATRLEQNVSFALTNGETRTVVISQPLIQTGIWSLSVVTNGVEASSYTFNVVRSQSEADYQITQYQTTRFYRYLIIVTFLISIIAFAIAFTALARPARTIKIKQEETGFEPVASHDGLPRGATGGFKHLVVFSC